MEHFKPNIKKKVQENLTQENTTYRNELAQKLAAIRNISLEAAELVLEKEQDSPEYQKALQEITKHRNDAIDAKNEIHSVENEIHELKGEIHDLENRLTEKKRNFEQVSVEQALEIMGESQFIGPKDIENTFGFSPENVPEVPFSSEELERAKELGQQLILYIDSKEDESAFTAQAMKDLLDGKTSDGGEFLYSERHSKDDQKLAEQTPRAGWRLTTPEIIENSTSKNYLDQTQELVHYLQNEVFAGEDVPEVYQEAIDEFNAQKDTLSELMNSDWQEATKKLSELTINQLTRERSSEILYRLAVAEKKSGNKNLEAIHSWSNSLASGGELVDVGYFGSDRVRVGRWRPDYSIGDIGVCFSRSAS